MHWHELKGQRCGCSSVYFDYLHDRLLDSLTWFYEEEYSAS